MEIFFSVKIFSSEVLPDLHVLKTPELKKWFLKISACVCVLLCGEYSALNISKTKKTETPNFIHRTR